jgi:hypothetical protein
MVGGVGSFFVASLPHRFITLNQTTQKGLTMSPKSSISVNATIDSRCQHISPKGNRCHMLIDRNHRPPNGAASPTLCAYHTGRLGVSTPAVDPEVLAAELLEDINSFTTADEVNLFLGNLVRQLVRKRIARRDALALAYISQLILSSQTAMARQRADEEDDFDLSFAKGFLQQAQKLSGAPPAVNPRVAEAAAKKGADDPRPSA